MDINTFHLQELLQVSKISIKQLSRITGVTEPTLKAIKDGNKARIYNDTYSNILKGYYKYLQDNMEAYNKTSIFYTKHI